MRYEKPLVSIGMPVYNSEQFIRHSLDSLLEQDYENFELIISDNVSTDRTQEICKEYQAKDKRVIYFWNEKNLGSVQNFDQLINLGRGKYFMWARSSDLWHKSFISQCASLLEKDSNIILAYPNAARIDSEGKILENSLDQMDTRCMTLIQRYKYVFDNVYCGNMVYGLIRRKLLIRSGSYKNLIWGDRIFLSKLALWGSFAQVEDTLQFRRKIRKDPEEIGWETYRADMLCRMNPQNKINPLKKLISYLFFECFVEQFKNIISYPVAFSEKLKLLKYIFIVYFKTYVGLFSFIGR
jgi:glycosyltransferase involved in cell wall biosynthesis